eukprot:1461654-Rhodomonas_salina.3
MALPGTDCWYGAARNYTKCPLRPGVSINASQRLVSQRVAKAAALSPSLRTLSATNFFFPLVFPSVFCR